MLRQSVLRGTLEKALRSSPVLASLLILMQPSHAQESAKFEKIHEVSPDGKFAVRISCGSAPEDPDKIDPDLITTVELVSLPSKKIVIKNLSDRIPDLIWSKDSNWLAYSFSSGSRVTDTYVYHRSDDDFSKFEADLEIDVKGDVRNQYVHPIRWLKPGVLLLEQYDIFRGGSGDATYRFTAKFDEKTGKFQIISKKKVPSKE
jgi:hypothetical protein